MKLYKYDNDKNYVGEIEADPKDPVPRNATPKKPIDGNGYNVWTGKSWVLKDSPNVPPAPLPPAIPNSITRRQGKQQLVIAGLDEQVELAIDGIVDATERKLTRIWYQDSQQWERDNEQLQTLGDALGLSEEQIDDLFKAASQL